MPAFVAHFLIARGVFPKDVLPGEATGCLLLGSVGPDLPHLRNVLGSAIGEFFEERFNESSFGLYGGTRTTFMREISERERSTFLTAVSDADLTGPLVTI